MEGIKQLDEIYMEVEGFIRDNYLFGYEENELDGDASILEMGVVDSTGIIELVVFVEEKYDVQVMDSEIIPDNFDSVNRISRYVQRKISGGTI